MRGLLLACLVLLCGCEARTIYTDYYVGDFYKRAESAVIVREVPGPPAVLIGQSVFTDIVPTKYDAKISAQQIGANVLYIVPPQVGATGGVGGMTTAGAFGGRGMQLYDQDVRFYRDHSKPGLENSPDVVIGSRE